MDVDGTLTDGKIYMSEDGECMKAFHVKDGLGIREILPQYGILPVIITGRKSKILEKRCQELGIRHVYQSISDKYTCMMEMTEKFQYSLSEIAFIGDDINDLLCIKSCGISGCPADAVEEVKKSVNYICSNYGGNGAVREFIYWLCNCV